ncbi:MAG: Rieske 2Fe-2S domain-containing protein [Cyclobacteriaceae bacterium]|nr:Rieske 2Fe-2S domain-containing protein [Cyclobacteriaceae bacterium]
MNWVKIFNSLQEAQSRLTENKPQLVVAGSIRICLVMRGDQFFAVSNRCTHNGESLSKGRVNFSNEIVCPWHGYQFDLRTGREYRQRSADLETFPVKIEADGVYIGM